MKRSIKFRSLSVLLFLIASLLWGCTDDLLKSIEEEVNDKLSGEETQMMTLSLSFADSDIDTRLQYEEISQGDGRAMLTKWAADDKIFLTLSPGNPETVGYSSELSLQSGAGTGKGVIGQLLSAGHLLDLGGVLVQAQTVDHGRGAALHLHALKGLLESLQKGVGQGGLFKKGDLYPVILENSGHVGQHGAVGHDDLELGGVYPGAGVLDVAEVGQQEGLFGEDHHEAVGVVETRQVALVDLGGDHDGLGVSRLHGGLELGKMGHGFYLLVVLDVGFKCRHGGG